MLSFADTLTEQKNTHMTHIEDKVLYGGVNGVRQAIFALRDMRDMLAGKKEGSMTRTIQCGGEMTEVEWHQLASLDIDLI